MNAPPSRPLMSLLMLSVMPLRRMFLIMDVMWLAGNRLQKDCTPSENCESGMYAPMTNPAAAVRIPKNAVLVEEFLKSSMITIKRAVEDTDPRRTIP